MLTWRPSISRTSRGGRGNDLLKSVVYAMSPEAVTDVWVHGRRVVEQRRLTSTSEEDLVARGAALAEGWPL